MLRVYNYIRPRGVTMIGPNCPGALSPGKANVGIIPAEIFSEGSIGLVSRSGTLTYQIGHELTGLGLGNSTIVGIGGDPVVGSSFIDVLARFEADAETELVVMVGEIGGDEEEKAARFIAGGDVEAGGRVHRRVQRAAGQDDGPRRRDHHRLLRHGRGEEGGARGERAFASAPLRPRPRRSRPRSPAVDHNRARVRTLRMGCGVGTSRRWQAPACSSPPRSARAGARPRGRARELVAADALRGGEGRGDTDRVARELEWSLELRIERRGPSLAACAGTAIPNLLRDPGDPTFESTVAPWIGYGGAELSRNGAHGKSGRSALKVSASGTASPAGFRLPDESQVDTGSGHKYAFSAWVYSAEPRSIRLGFDQRETKTGPSIGVQSADRRHPGAGWTFLSFTAATASTARYLDPFVEVPDPGPFSIWVENVVLADTHDGSTDAAYVVRPEDVGSRLRVVVTATNDNGEATATSEPTAYVAE